MAQLLALRTVLGILDDVRAPARPLAFFPRPAAQNTRTQGIRKPIPVCADHPRLLPSTRGALSGTHGFEPQPTSTGSSASKAVRTTGISQIDTIQPATNVPLAGTHVRQVTQRGSRPRVAEGLAYFADPGSPPPMGDSAVCEVPQLRQYRNSGTRRLDLRGQKDLLATCSSMYAQFPFSELLHERPVPPRSPRQVS
ncbi:hypothetical protein HPB52_023351 [Rhipicephalus sanguineus]|uniref:Uncharacterized protein n=1 Tax=Rhipicephalus sanguineus TaxID=34632 RepID=A0A9D4QC25_RHISA|nr:hypothetical protein HPB52_023351 [Rhipicephalus sanguineus]